MRTITAAQHKLIKAIVAEGERDFPLGGLLEKDVHVTEALQAVARIEHPYVELVFCGGTCLAKAHRLIQRMSEDVDLKIVLDPAHGLSNDRLRQHLSALKARIADAMEALGFVAVEGSQRARNQNRYFCSDWHYEPLLSKHSSLRPYLRLECIVRTPLAPTTPLPIGYLYDHLLDRPAEAPCMSCISIQETLAEKVHHAEGLGRRTGATHL